MKKSLTNLCVLLLVVFCAYSMANAQEARVEISQLITELLSSNDHIRNNAEHQLIAMGDTAIPYLEKVLFSDEKESQVLKGVVTRLLGKLGSPAAIPSLLFVIESNQEEFVKVGAIASLKEIGKIEPEVVASLRKALHDLSTDVRVAAANTLAGFGDAVSDLGIELLLLSGSSDVRFGWACQTAARKVSPGILPLKDDTITELINRLTTLEWQDLAVTILAKNSSLTLPRIVELVLDLETNAATRVSAFKVLQRIGVPDEKTLNQIIDIVLDDQEPMTIKIAASNILKDMEVAKYPQMAEQIKKAINMEVFSNYINDNQIAIQVENFAIKDRQNVAVHTLVGFSEEYNIQKDTCLTVRDHDEHLIYSEIKPITYWDSEETIVRTAQVTLFPNLQALEPSVYYIDLNSKEQRVAKPENVDQTGQVRVSFLEKGLELILATKLDLQDRWLTQVTVAIDGTGNYTTIQEAIDSVPINNTEQVVIYIKEGVYHEKLVIPKNKSKISFVGEDKENTVLDFNETPTIQNSPDGIYNTWGSASTIILSDDFTAENITFSNSAPVGTGQALAIRLEGDRISLVNNKFLSTQDTVYANGEGRQYFYDCYIAGDVDFIFGSAIAVFENCDIVNVRKTGGYITAASTPEEQEFGFVFINSRIIGDVNPGSVWLGRPWRPYSHTAYINCYMSEVVQPTGWHNWGKTSNEATARYIEYNSYGPGANPDGRVGWSRQLTDEEASNYTAENILRGNDNWNPGFK